MAEKKRNKKEPHHFHKRWVLESIYLLNMKKIATAKLQKNRRKLCNFQFFFTTFAKILKVNELWLKN